MSGVRLTPYFPTWRATCCASWGLKTLRRTVEVEALPPVFGSQTTCSLHSGIQAQPVPSKRLMRCNSVETFYNCRDVCLSTLLYLLRGNIGQLSLALTYVLGGIHIAEPLVSPGHKVFICAHHRDSSYNRAVSLAFAPFTRRKFSDCKKNSASFLACSADIDDGVGRLIALSPPQIFMARIAPSVAVFQSLH